MGNGQREEMDRGRNQTKPNHAKLQQDETNQTDKIYGQALRPGLDGDWAELWRQTLHLTNESQLAPLCTLAYHSLLLYYDVPYTIIL